MEREGAEPDGTKLFVAGVGDDFELLGVFRLEVPDQTIVFVLFTSWPDENGGQAASR